MCARNTQEKPPNSDLQIQAAAGLSRKTLIGGLQANPQRLKPASSLVPTARLEAVPFRTHLWADL